MATSTSPFVLLKFEDNYADEFNVAGFLVVTRAHWTKRQKEIKSIEHILEMCFGTNEELQWANGKDLLSKITTIDLDEPQADLYKQHFSLNGYWHSYTGEGGNDWRADILAGHGEIGFLDNI